MTFDGPSGVAGGGQAAGGENKSTVALYADKKKNKTKKKGKKDKTNKRENHGQARIKKEIQLC